MKIPVEFNALGELPDGWSWQPLQSLTANPKQDVVDGPFGSNLKASEYVSKGVPIARLQNVDRNTFVTKNIRFLTPDKAANLARHEFKPDDILITKLGDPLGKACIVPASIGRGVIVADLVRVRPDEKLVDRKYLTYAINSPTLVKQFELHTKGTTRPRVNLSVLRQLPIPLAPRKIQTRIVAELEKQFSRLDEAVANLQRVKANLKRYKASVLKDAVGGRLVPTEAELARREGRSFETGEQLLLRILETRRVEWKGRDAFSESSSATVGTGDLPAGWVWTTLGQCFHVAVGATPSRKESSYWGGDIPWVSSGEVQLNRIRHTDEHISAAGLANSSTQLNPAGSVMIGMIGQGKTRGQAAILDIEAANNQNCAAIWVSRTAIPTEYVFFWLMSRYTETRSEGSGNNQQALNKRLVEQIPLPLPPLAEQQRIVAEVDRRLSLVQSVQAEVDANLKRAQALRQATLAKALSASPRGTE